MLQHVLNTDVIVEAVEVEDREENLPIMMTEEEAWIESLLVLTTEAILQITCITIVVTV